MQDKSSKAKRSINQNDAYYGWLKALSNELINKGVDMKEMIAFEIMPTPQLIHDNITHRLIKKFYNKDSTADLTTAEMSEIVEVIRQGFIKKTDGQVDVPFIPNQDYEQYVKNTKAIETF